MFVNVWVKCEHLHSTRPFSVSMTAIGAAGPRVNRTRKPALTQSWTVVGTMTACTWISTSISAGVAVRTVEDVPAEKSMVVVWREGGRAHCRGRFIGVKWPPASSGTGMAEFLYWKEQKSPKLLLGFRRVLARALLLQTLTAGRNSIFSDQRGDLYLLVIFTISASAELRIRPIQGYLQ